MKKKINVLTVMLKCHIPLDPGKVVSVQLAASCAEGLREAGNKLGQTTMETRLNRISAPAPEASEPEPAGLAGTPETRPVAAE